MKFNRIKKKQNKVNYIYVIIVILIIISVLFIFDKKENNIPQEKNNILKEEKVSLEEIKANYNEFVKLKNNSYLYTKEEDKYTQVITINGEIEINLDNDYQITDEYFKLKNSDYYVKYDTLTKIDNLRNITGEYKYYKNYIPYNENIILNNNSKLFIDDINYYEVSGGSYPIIIKDSDKYGIEFNNNLVYVNITDVKEVVESNNTNQEIASDVSVLNYHFVVDREEMKSCAQSICLRDENFDSQIKYLKDNSYYAVSLRDLELFIDGKIRLPKRSVSITIDDGWYVQRAIWILEKYQMLGTLFLIGNLASPNDYISPYLEIHSHTWNMHGLKTGDDCPNSKFRGGITCFDEETILNDLKQSRESLNNTTYLCYPFYDYSNKAIELLKKAGFTMAFAGQNGTSVKVGQDKFRIPRYVIYSNTSMDNFISYVS